MRIVWMSDMHTGTPLFRPEFPKAAVEEANSLVRFSRRAVTMSEIFPELERFVRYDEARRGD